MNEKEFVNKVVPLRDKLYRLALRLLGRPDDAEDAVQETLVRLWQKSPDEREIESLEAFAFRCTKNLCLDYIRTDRNRRELIRENYDANIYTIRPDEKMESSETMNRINTLIEKLPEKQKIIIHLRDIEGLTNQRIAEIMGMTSEAVRTNLSRARKLIRERILKAYKYEYYKH
ncbi:MAG: RNA polymerase sigma factor [Candidatus Kapaibacterium sp.]